MNLFGFEIRLSRNGKFKEYVRRDECHAAQERVKASIDGLKDHFDIKIDALNNRITDLISKR